MTFVADVDAGGVGMHNFQLRTFRLKTSLQSPAFSPAQFLPLAQSLKTGHLSLGHAIVSLFLNWAKLGSVGHHSTDSLTGSSLAFTGQLATQHWIAATEVMLCDGHEGTEVETTIACRAWTPGLIRSPWAESQVALPYGSRR